MPPSTHTQIHTHTHNVVTAERRTLVVISKETPWWLSCNQLTNQVYIKREGGKTHRGRGFWCREEEDKASLAIWEAVKYGEYSTAVFGRGEMITLWESEQGGQTQKAPQPISAERLEMRDFFQAMTPPCLWMSKCINANTLGDCIKE